MRDFEATGRLLRIWPPHRSSMHGLIAGLLLSLCLGPLGSVATAQDVKVAPQDLPDDIAVILNSLNREKLDEGLLASVKAMSHPAARVMIVGDSHAGRIHPPLAQWGLTNNIEIDHLRIGGGCPPLLNTYVFATNQKGDGEECNQATTNTLLELGNSNYDTVVFVARWGMYASELSPGDGRVEGKALRKYKSISRDPNRGFVKDLAPSEEAFEAGVRETIKYFKSKGKRVIVVTQPPPVNSEFFRCLKTQTAPGDIAEKCVVTTHANQTTEIAWTTEALVRLGSELGFEVINASEIFCTDGPCKASNKQGIFFIDSNHLSSVGASFLADDVEKVLSKSK